MTKKLIILTPLLFIGLMAMAQSTSDKKMSKAEKKEARKEKQKANLNKILEAIEDRAFAIKAHTFVDKQGLSIPISPSTNFVAVSEDEGVVQFAFGDNPGLNGLGGLTIEGKIVKYELKKHKKGLSLQMRLFGSAFGSTDLILGVNSSGIATVKVNTIRGGQFTFNATFSDLESAKIFQGSSIY